MEPVVVIGNTIRPALPEGDAFFGLAPGTNGTASTTRRALVAPPDAHWERFNGKPATGIYLSGSGSDTNVTWNDPWSGR